MALDKKQMAVLIILDLSAAFNTLKHSVLIKRLSQRFGIKDSALDWIKSYLKDRNQYVQIGKNSSNKLPLETGVPQGSILGPILFIMYMAPLADIISNHKLNSHFYADDSQLYTFFNPNKEIDVMLAKIENCIKDIKIFMDKNFLKLNEEKTEIIIFGSEYNIKNFENHLLGLDLLMFYVLMKFRI